eukprot:86907-Hanusia_phi.AAC.5
MSIWYILAKIYKTGRDAPNVQGGTRLILLQGGGRGRGCEGKRGVGRERRYFRFVPSFPTHET